jgi:cell filamentation protein
MKSFAALAPAMASSSLPDPYLNESTGILRNMVGARTPEALTRAEASLSLARLSALIENPPTPTADLNELRAIHRALFQDVYDWAGEVRTIDLRKRVPNANTFAPWQSIEQLGFNQSALLAEDDFLLARDRDRFAEGLARHYESFNYLHPFREGNGRVQRLFWDRISLEAGWSVDWSQVNGEIIGRLSREAGNTGEISDLVAMFRSISNRYLSPMTRVEQRSWLVDIALESHEEPDLSTSTDAINSAGVAMTVAAGRCGKLRANGRGVCMRRVGENGCPYHG